MDLGQAATDSWSKICVFLLVPSVAEHCYLGCEPQTVCACLCACLSEFIRLNTHTQLGRIWCCCQARLCQLDPAAAVFLSALLAFLELLHLLQDWDLFYLKISCCHKLGQNVSKHLRPVYGTAGAIAYMMTPSFARKALKAARDPRLNSWVDIILMSMGRHFEGNMYAVQPPLVLGDQALNSTLTAHYFDASKDSDWERKWMEYGHWGRLSGAAARWNSK